MDGYIGTILPWAATFAPRNWAFCNGQLIPLSQSQALYSLIGTIYGGDGRATVGLPNLQSRVMIGHGQIPGLQAYALGQVGGIDLYRLSESQMPTHTHDNAVNGTPSTVTTNIAIPSVSGSDANMAKPTNTAVLGKMTGTTMYSTNAPDSNLKPFNASGTVTPLVSISNAPAGSGNLIDNRPPYQAVNFIICIDGLYPARN
jgi:microcystin-dependent protein